MESQQQALEGQADRLVGDVFKTTGIRIAMQNLRPSGSGAAALDSLASGFAEMWAPTAKALSALRAFLLLHPGIGVHVDETVDRQFSGPRSTLVDDIAELKRQLADKDELIAAQRLEIKSSESGTTSSRHGTSILEDDDSMEVSWTAPSTPANSSVDPF